MDKRVIGFAVLAVLIGAIVLYTEVWIIGLFAAQAGPVMPRDITRSELELRGFWHGLLWLWGLPSALGALLIAFFKPRRWLLYSLCAILPDLALTLGSMIDLVSATGTAYLGPRSVEALLHLSLMPSFLALYYALIRRHSAA